MPGESDIDEDVRRVAQAIAHLREQAPKVSQRLAAEHHPKKISHQYWAMNEQGQVPGIVKPSTQRDLLAAISRAKGLETPLTLDDLHEAMAMIAGAPGGDRALRMAASLRPVSPERRAVFPTSDGDVVFSFPAEMSPEGFRELEAYFQVFVKANAPKA